MAEIRQIGPAVAARSAAIESNGTLPSDVVDLIRPTGAFRMYVPDDLDGPGVNAWQSLEVLEELAYHDGAAGWCAMIGSTSSLLSSFLPDIYAKEIFGGRDSIAGGFAMPKGKATVVDGGLRVTGTWAWGSGTRHCTWVGGGCRLVDDNGEPAPRADGLSVPFVFFPAEDVEFVDNWQVSGLEGTGSGDYRVTDLFVPEGRWVQMGRDPAIRKNALSRFSFFGLLACGVASCAMGIGRRSVDELIALSGKKPQGSARTLAQRSTIQADVAKAEAKLASAWAFMNEAISETWQTTTTGGHPSTHQKQQLRLAATHATHEAAEVARLMYTAGGGEAIYRSSPLQRCFRDVSVATQHAMVAPRTLEALGAISLGNDSKTDWL